MVIQMKITDSEQNIKYIVGIHKGKIPPSTSKCNSRHSDCFVYVLSGEAEYTFKNRSHTSTAGDIVYLSHNSTYSIHVTDENYTFIYIDFFLKTVKIQFMRMKSTVLAAFRYLKVTLKNCIVFGS